MSQLLTRKCFRPESALIHPGLGRITNPSVPSVQSGYDGICAVLSDLLPRLSAQADLGVLESGLLV